MSMLRVVEAAYGAEDDDRTWLTSIATLLRPKLGGSLGIAAYRFCGSLSGGLQFHDVVFLGDHDGARRGLQAVSGLAPWLARRLFGKGFVCGSLSRLAGRAFRRHRPIDDHLRANGVMDAIGITIRDVTGDGVVFCAASDEENDLRPRDVRALSLVGAHISAAQRLRVTAGESLELAEAVLTPAGSVEHATGAAKSTFARAALRVAAAAFDRARTRRRRDDTESLSLWNALVAGRWSLVDHFDRDGRRFVIARRNDPRLRAGAALTLKERQAAAYASLGHSNKLIAYHLGISQAAVANRLASACRKLGVRSRARLIDVWARLERTTESDA